MDFPSDLFTCHFLLNIHTFSAIVYISLSAPITTEGEVYLLQHYVIKFVSDLRQVGGFLRVLQFSPTNKI